MWKPKCCDITSIKDIEPALQYEVALYGNTQNTVNTSSQQITTFVDVPLLTLRCHIRDRSTAAQDTAINQNFKNAENTKEFICDYFNLAQYSFTKLAWSGVSFKVLGVNPYSSVTINGTRFYAPEGKYYVGIQAGITKL
jgi:hypothetical protein